MKTTWKANSGNHQSAERLTQPPVHVLRTSTVTLFDAVRVNSSFVGGNSFLESGLESTIL